MGWQFYIVGVGTSIFEGTFKFKAWIEKGTANEYVTPKPKEEPKPEPPKEEPKKEPEPEPPVLNITEPEKP